MIGYSPFPGRARMPAWQPSLAQAQPPSVLPGIQDLPIEVPPFGLPPVTSGAILLAGGLVSGAVGIYLSYKGAAVLRKKNKRIPTYWEWYFGIGGVGATLAVLGAIPLVAVGVMEIAGGVIIKKKLEEIGQTVQKGVQQAQQPK